MMNVLYVENHPVFATTVTRQFLFHHAVIVVPGLNPARQALRDQVFDVLLVDYDLDDGKGDELVRELRASGNAVPIIAVSSHDEGNAALLEAGATSVCSKEQFARIESLIHAATGGEAMGDGTKRTGLLWWAIPRVLAGMPMPFIHPMRRLNMGGSLNAYDDELPMSYSAGIRAVVSLLNIPSDARVYETAGFAFFCLPVLDGRAPTLDQACNFVGFVERHLVDNQPVAVHCAGGLGRTGTMLAAYLIAKGDGAAEAIRRVRQVEKCAIESAEQIQFLERFAAMGR